MKSLYIFLLLLLSSSLFSQDEILPGLEGQQLIDALVRDYKPDTVLSYGPARDSLFANVYAENDTLECQYTGLKVYLDPTQDPTQFVFKNGTDLGINTEHIWPQSKGARNEPPKSDMHHLYPTRVDVNGDRGSLPFAEVNDNSTNIWYGFDRKQSSIPSTNRDAWSEVGNSTFEPRESIKGNVARAMFYFYTMYRAEADAQDNQYFGIQRRTFCEWHFDDQTDFKEYQRSQRIATYQDDKANPFVLDCTLAFRTYCSDVSGTCLTNLEETPILVTAFDAYPNPFQNTLSINYELPHSGVIELSVYNLLGQQVETLAQGFQTAGTYELEWIPSGDKNNQFYFLHLVIERDGQQQRIIHKIIAR